MHGSSLEPEFFAIWLKSTCNVLCDAHNSLLQDAQTTMVLHPACVIGGHSSYPVEDQLEALNSYVHGLWQTSTHGAPCGTTFTEDNFACNYNDAKPIAVKGLTKQLLAERCLSVCESGWSGIGAVPPTLLAHTLVQRTNTAQHGQLSCKGKYSPPRQKAGRIHAENPATELPHNPAWQRSEKAEPAATGRARSDQSRS